MRRRFGIKSVLATGTVLLVGAVLSYFYLFSYMADDGLFTVAGKSENGAFTEKDQGASSGAAVELLGYSDLLDEQTFEEAKIGGLSAIAYDPRRGLYHALVDRKESQPARFYTLRVPLDSARLGEPSVFDVTILRDSEGKDFGAGRSDGEGMVITPWGDLIVSSEVEPSIRRFSGDGRLLQELPVPEKFLVEKGGGQPNDTFEGLALTGEAKSLLVAPQKELTFDAPFIPQEDQQRIRLLRYENRGLEDFQPSEEFFYLADTDGGVADMIFVSERELLVLEQDNRVFRVDLAGAEDVSGVESLADTSVEPLKKELLVDLEKCTARKEDNAGLQQDSPAVSYEGLTFGPSLPDGRKSLLFVSDDNFKEDQVTRLLALGVRAQYSQKEAASAACQ